MNARERFFNLPRNVPRVYLARLPETDQFPERVQDQDYPSGLRGDVWKLLPLWIEGGVTVVYPFEVAAGMDIVEVRKAFPKLGIISGIDKRVIAQGKAAIDRELEAKVPFMLQHGGYIPTVDHHVPPDTSFENFKYYREKLNQIIKSYSKYWDRD